MAPLIAIEAAEDPRLADYVSLRDVSLRRHLESEQGLFIAEGSKVIRRAVEAGYRPRSFLLAERWLDELRDLLARFAEVPVYVVSEAMAEAVTGFHVHRGALASLHRETRHTVAQLLGVRRLVVVEDIVDHTNVGAIARNAAGLGWDGLLLSSSQRRPALSALDQGLHGGSLLPALGAAGRLGDGDPAPCVPPGSWSRRSP